MRQHPNSSNITSVCSLVEINLSKLHVCVIWITTTLALERLFPLFCTPRDFSHSIPCGIFVWIQNKRLDGNCWWMILKGKVGQDLDVISLLTLSAKQRCMYSSAFLFSSLFFPRYRKIHCQVRCHCRGGRPRFVQTHLATQHSNHIKFQLLAVLLWRLILSSIVWLSIRPKGLRGSRLGKGHTWILTNQAPTPQMGRCSSFEPM